MLWVCLALKESNVAEHSRLKYLNKINFNYAFIADKRRRLKHFDCTFLELIEDMQNSFRRATERRITEARLLATRVLIEQF